MNRWKLSVLLFVATGTSPILAATPEEVREAVLAKFTVTTRSVLGRVKDPGTVLVVQKQGLRADPPRGLMRPSKIREGELVEVGGGALIGGNAGHSLAVGERLHLYRLDVKDDYVLLLIATTATYDIEKDGNTQAVPFEAGVSFRYEQGVAQVSADQVLADIGVWFKTESDSAAASTKTVSLGQSPDEVVAILGAPKKKVELGPKTIYVYDDLKVVFLDGKVADVE